MSYDEIVEGISLPANADLSASQFLFGTITNSSGQGRVAVSGDGADADGVIYEGGNAAGQVTKLAVKGVLKVIAGGNVTAGQLVASDATGKAVVAASGDKVLGKAITSAVSGDVFPILWKPVG